MSTNQADQIIETHTTTALKLLDKGTDGVNAFFLYNFYCLQAALQQSSKVYATDYFCMTGLKWGRVKFFKAKALLVKQGVIKVEIERSSNGQIAKNTVNVSYYQAKTSGIKNRTAVPPQSGFQNHKLTSNKKLNLDNKLSKQTESLEKPKTFGNEKINFLLEKFQSHYGFPPTDHKPRWEARHLALQLDKFIKSYGKEADMAYFTRATNALFKWLWSQEWSENIQTIGTVRRKAMIFFCERRCQTWNTA